MTTFQFRWTEATCVTGNCIMNYAANAETLEYACYEVITRHLDNTGLLMWDFNESGASSSLGTLAHVPEVVAVVDTFPLTSETKETVSVEDAYEIHWTNEEDNTAPASPKAQKSKVIKEPAK
jgi:hypothetical protein